MTPWGQGAVGEASETSLWGVTQIWVQIPALPLNSWMTSGKLFHLPESVLSYKTGVSQLLWFYQGGRST